MSIDYTVHVGPYVECTNPFVEIDVKKRGCTNPICQLYKNAMSQYGVAAFCQGCGQPIGEWTIKKRGTKTNSSETHDEMGEQLYRAATEYGFKELKNENAEIEIWIANVKRPNCGVDFDPKCENHYFDLTEHNHEEEIEGFLASFAVEIDKLEKAYGKNNVKVKWGVFNWGQ
jgi:hypothetical protein